MNEIIGATIETARNHFLNQHEGFYNFAIKTGSRDSLEYWLDNTDPLEKSVNYAATKHLIDSEEILDQVRASLKFRVLAGILTKPVDYQDSDLQGGLCACQEYDSETGGWPCKVPNNQSQADAWHSRFGNSPACPFWENPSKRNPLENKQTEIEKMIYEGETLEDAWRQLGLRAK